MLRLHRFALAVGLTSTFVAAFAAHALANPLCGDRTGLIRALSDRYHEAPTSMGLSSDGSVIEVLASETGSWTILMTRPDGLTCMMASGEGWEILPPRMAEGPKV